MWSDIGHSGQLSVLNGSPKLILNIQLSDPAVNFAEGNMPLSKSDKIKVNQDRGFILYNQVSRAAIPLCKLLIVV